MPEVFFHTLSSNDRRDALGVAAGQSGRPAYLLEKDIWVVHALRLLFDAPFGEHLAFKGGTSLSKAYKAIRRFSEDIDITYDIRVIAPDLASEINKDLSLTRSQSDKRRRKIRRQLGEQVRERILPNIGEGLSRSGLSARVYVDKESLSPTLRIAYSPLFDDYSFVKSEVMIEFDARATGEPREERIITCDAAEFLSGDVKFPSARASVLLAERTFLEKATAIHVFCLQERRRGERLSRHWHDLVRLNNAGYADKALADRPLVICSTETREGRSGAFGGSKGLDSVRCWAYIGICCLFVFCIPSIMRTRSFLFGVLPILCGLFIAVLFLSSCDSGADFSSLDDIAPGDGLTAKARVWYAEQMEIEISERLSKVESNEDSLTLLS